MKDDYNYLEDYDDRLEDYDERSIMELEKAVGGCLGLVLGFAVALIVCSIIYIFSV